MDTFPNIVVDGIGEAVRTAIQFGVSAADFKRLVITLWDDELRLKRERDLKELAK